MPLTNVSLKEFQEKLLKMVLKQIMEQHQMDNLNLLKMEQQLEVNPLLMEQQPVDNPNLLIMVVQLINLMVLI